MNQLAEKAVLMRFSQGLPGRHRKDKRVTSEVQSERAMSKDSGKWIKDLFPEDALKEIKAKQGEAQAYHDSVTFPFGATREDADNSSEDSNDKKPRKMRAMAGILPATLYCEYGDTMRQFKGEMEKLVDDFLRDPWKWVGWAKTAHNGTFDPSNYPGCSVDAAGNIQIDAVKWDREMRKKFYIHSEPFPVPGAEHFTEAISNLLGLDAQSVNVRVSDAVTEAQRELLARMKDPVLHMAAKLSGQTCHCRSCKGRASKTANFKDSLVQNIQEVAALVPKMNLGGDPELDAFAAEMNKLGSLDPEVLRVDDSAKSAAAEQAAAVLKRLEGYKL